MFGHSDILCWGSHPFFPVLILYWLHRQSGSNSEGSSDPASFLSSHLKPEIYNRHAWLCCRDALSRHESQNLPRESLRENSFAALLSSTQSFYSYCCITWIDWCLQRKMDFIYPSVAALADILIFFFEEKKLFLSLFRDIGLPFYPC